MREYVFILLNLAVANYLFWNYYSETDNYVSLNSSILCLNQTHNNNNLCVQCISRVDQYPQEKGFLIGDNLNYLIIKVQNDQNYLECSQYLQMIDFKNSLSGTILTENLPSIGMIMKQISSDAIFIDKGEHIVEPKYHQFAIFRIFSQTEYKIFNIKIPSLQKIINVNYFFAYLMHAMVGIVFLMFIFKISTKSHLGIKVIISLACTFISLYLLIYNLGNRGIVLVITRLLLISTSLYRIDAANKTVALSFFIGLILILGLDQLGFCINLFIIWTYIFIRGLSDKDIRSIWTYLLICLLCYLPIMSVWYVVYGDRADTACRFLELTLLILTPLGIVGIQDSKYAGFKFHRPIYNQKSSISLSGYQQDGEQQQGTRI